MTKERKTSIYVFEPGTATVPAQLCLSHEDQAELPEHLWLGSERRPSVFTQIGVNLPLDNDI